ncbi:MAG: twin-arginine translocase subunit TatC [Opitutae bacterium]|nr:twin-arginine translocase subunit TatC [Opitutae bacterium]
MVAGENEDLEKAGGLQMTFLEHLEELRHVLFKSALAFFIALMVVAVLFLKFKQFLVAPLETAMANHGVTEALVTTGPFGVFSFLLQMGFMGGISLASPFILYFVATFVAPGLNVREKRVLLPGCAVGLILFCLGCLFSYFVLIPAALNVSIYLNKLLGLELIWRADRYISLLLWMVLGIGLSFEFPLAITLLVYVGILNQQQLKNVRRYAVVGFFVLAAIITPTGDPFTQLLMAVPMWLLYEGAIIVAGIIERKRKREYEAEYGKWEKDDYYDFEADHKDYDPEGDPSAENESDGEADSGAEEKKGEN